MEQPDPSTVVFIFADFLKFCGCFHKLIRFVRSKPPLLYLCLRGNYHVFCDSSPAQGKKGATEFTEADH